MTSMLFFHGVDSVSISHRLGHSSVSTTTSIYSHVMQQAESRISDCMADVLLTTQKGRQEEEGGTCRNSKVSLPGGRCKVQRPLFLWRSSGVSCCKVLALKKRERCPKGGKNREKLKKS